MRLKDKINMEQLRLKYGFVSVNELIKMQIANQFKNLILRKNCTFSLRHFGIISQNN